MSRWVKSDEHGAAMVEYAVLIAMIAVVVVVALSLVGPKVSSSYSDVGDAFDPNSSLRVGTTQPVATTVATVPPHDDDD